MIVRVNVVQLVRETLHFCQEFQKPLAVATMIGGVGGGGRLGFPSCPQASCGLAEGRSHLRSPGGRGYLYPSTWRFSCVAKNGAITTTLDAFSYFLEIVIKISKNHCVKACERKSKLMIIVCAKYPVLGVL